MMRSFQNMASAVWMVVVTVGMFAATGCTSVARLVEQHRSVAGKSYASPMASMTLSIPVAYEPPPIDFMSPVTGVNLFGELYVDGVFPAGKIIADEFRRVVSANFAAPSPVASPVAKLLVRIARVSAKRIPGDCVEASVDVEVSIRKAGGAESSYARTFSASCVEKWPDATVVPSSFYSALDAIVGDFLVDWQKSCSVATLVEWEYGKSPGVIPPELESLKFVQDGDVHCGSCVVACNDYEGFKAKAWTQAHIEQSCARKLGVEQERVRIVYDKEKFDPQSKTWRLEFRTFVRAEKVLTFNAASGFGFVTGDLGLMGLPAEAAAEELRRYVKAEMNARTGGATANVEFNDFTTDGVFNLITIGFWLKEAKRVT